MLREPTYYFLIDALHAGYHVLAPTPYGYRLRTRNAAAPGYSYARLEIL